MKHFIPSNRRSITTINAARLLKQHGTNVSLDEAKLILDMLYIFAKLSGKHLIDSDSGINPPDKKTPRKLFR